MVLRPSRDLLHSNTELLVKTSRRLSYIPSIEGIPTNKFKAHSKIKGLKKLIKDFNSYVASIQYQGNSKTDITELTEYLLPYFDLIIDLRNLNGNRVICSLIRGRKNPNYVYYNPRFEKYLAA